MIHFAINIFYQNARGLRTKVNLFKRNVALNCFDIISITETWLLDGIADSELFDERYLVWRRDRDYQSTGQRLGGGVLLAVRRELAAAGQPAWHSSAEDVWVTVSFRTGGGLLTLHLCTVYLCNQKGGNSMNTQLNNFTSKLGDCFLSAPTDLFMVLGDFNMPNITWNPQDNGLLEPQGTLNECQVSFLDTIVECNLDQYNNVLNIHDRLLDLVFCNKHVIVQPSDHPLVPDDSHHRSICIELTLDIPSFFVNKPALSPFGTTVVRLRA
ncbi:uncharacterized protein LOC114355163 [Ostrinia furnacalis]|uniref:uncharacterized protein LOC114355163 n=1 Tax=Ostrinia furnacalis TaxID=93504 RepID=UPI00103FC6EA|nr:uncharacterized protein LOC114355163 [Ostrinia furnacalis]